MTKATYHLGIKILALFLAIIGFVGTVVSGLGILYCEESDFYDTTPSYYTSSLCTNITNAVGERILLEHDHSGATLEQLQQKYGYPNTNVSFDYYDSDGALLWKGETPPSIGSVSTLYHLPEYGYISYSPTAVSFNDEGPLTPHKLTLSVAMPLDAQDSHKQGLQLFENLYEIRYVLVASAFGFFALFFLAISYLLCAAGHRPDEEGIVPNIQDNLPFDLYFLLLCLASGISVPLLIYGIDSIESWYSFRILPMISILLFLFYNTGLGIAFLLSFATRLKLGGWWKNTIIFFLIRLCWRIVRGCVTFVSDIIHSIPTIWGVAAAWGFLSIFFVGSSYNPLGSMVLCFLLLVFFCLVASQMHQLKKAGEQLANGNLSYRVKTTKMLRSFKRHGNNLNSLSKGTAIALEQKIKSERLKTELITNVSHDIKTPLTSILNYVDLMKHTQMDEKGQEYLAVVDRQAKRLKKLTEDLVEASKASTGNIATNIVPTDLYELAVQAVAEYDSRAEEAGLEIVLQEPTEPIAGMVDGTLSWRVLNNLLSNAYKYSLTGTRIYIGVGKKENFAYFFIKNVSREKMNIPANDLLERFVRGDSSRSTEGSGLGLNIAKSLVELQKGKFLLQIDGDLVKVTVLYPLAELPPQPTDEDDTESKDKQDKDPLYGLSGLQDLQDADTEDADTEDTDSI